MTFYLVAGSGASTTATVSDDHLPSKRVRRYPSDTTDAEWQVIAPLIPAGRPGRRGGRPPRHPRRDIVDAIRYLAHNGCVWRALPADFPPWKTVYDYYARWTADGTVNHLRNYLREQVRAAAGRDPEPTVAIIDSQSCTHRRNRRLRQSRLRRRQAGVLPIWSDAIRSVPTRTRFIDAVSLSRLRHGRC